MKKIFSFHVGLFYVKKLPDFTGRYLPTYQTYLPYPTYFFRFIFLPENSTHFMQPLDVSVFRGMKESWRKILADWKQQCFKDGINHNGINKQEFPKLLRMLLDGKDFSGPIKSGFAATGLCPFDVQRALKHLPPDVEDMQAETEVQQILLNKLDQIKHNPPPTTRAGRPPKKDKLPPGQSHTCRDVVEKEPSVEDELTIEEEATVEDTLTMEAQPTGEGEEDFDATSSDSDASLAGVFSDTDESGPIISDIEELSDSEPNTASKKPVAAPAKKRAAAPPKKQAAVPSKKRAAVPAKKAPPAKKARATAAKGKSAQSVKGKGKGKGVAPQGTLMQPLQVESDSDSSDDDDTGIRSSKTARALVNIALHRSRIAYAKEVELQKSTPDSIDASGSSGKVGSRYPVGTGYCR